VLVASSDPSISPTSTFHPLQLQRTLFSLRRLTNTDVPQPDELPALKSGTLWVSRYHNIIDYLRKYSVGEWDLDRDLRKQQKADVIA
jgi:sorting and assembly machinery component 37